MHFPMRSVAMLVAGMGIVARTVGRRIVMMVFMAVVPKLRLVQQEEKNQADQQRDEQRLGAGLAFERLRQQVHEGCRHQRPGSQAQEMLGIDAAAAVAGSSRQAQAHEAGGKPDTADSGGQRGDQDENQGHRCFDLSNRPMPRWQNWPLLQTGASMPTIRVELMEGRTPEQKKNLVKALTEAVVETLGSKPESVDVVLYDVQRGNWATGGQLWSEKT